MFVQDVAVRDTIKNILISAHHCLDKKYEWSKWSGLKFETKIHTHVRIATHTNAHTHTHTHTHSHTHNTHSHAHYHSTPIDLGAEAKKPLLNLPCTHKGLRNSCLEAVGMRRAGFESDIEIEIEVATQPSIACIGGLENWRSRSAQRDRGSNHKNSTVIFPVFLWAIL